MALTLSSDIPVIRGQQLVWEGTATFDSSLASGGESFAPADIGFIVFDRVKVDFVDGYEFVWDSSTEKIIPYEVGPAASNTGAVVDDDSAASNGVAVYVVPVGGTSPAAYLESTAAGNADYLYAIGSGGPTVTVNDNDSPGGVQLYFDEDATNADSRFLCVSPTGADLFVQASDGSMIRVKHDASAASNGVAVYGDDDASNNYERLLFVSPTDTDGSYTTDDTVGAGRGGLVPVPASTDLSAVVANVTAYGH